MLNTRLKDRMDEKVETFERIKESTHKHYSHLVEEGYRWVTNTRSESASESARKYMSPDSLVEVRNVAFDYRGNIMPNYVAVLVKKLDKK